MVCDVYLGLSREGVGDLGRNWLDAGDEGIEKNSVQACFWEGVMLCIACDVCLRKSVCCINTVYVFDLVHCIEKCCITTCPGDEM